MTVVIDRNGNPIAVGSHVNTSDTMPPGEVVSISDPDGDVDDEGRLYGIDPRISVQWVDEAKGSLEAFGTSWTAKGPWDEGAPYQCDDLEVVV
jgi:hypothetical protein